MEEEKPKDIPEYRWFIALLADGSYHFVIPRALKAVEKYIGEHGGGVYTHAGYLVFAQNKRWFDWLTKEWEQQYADIESSLRPPQIDVPNIECEFGENAIQWLKDNDALLQEVGGKYYEFIPRH